MKGFHMARQANAAVLEPIATPAPGPVPSTVWIIVTDQDDIDTGLRRLRNGTRHELDRDQAEALVREGRARIEQTLKVQFVTSRNVDGTVTNRGDVRDLSPDKAELHFKSRTCVGLGDQEPFALDELPPDPDVKIDHALGAPMLKCRVVKKGVYGPSGRYRDRIEPGTEVSYREDRAIEGYHQHILVILSPHKEVLDGLTLKGKMYLHELENNNMLMGEFPEYGNPLPSTLVEFRKQRKAS
jgi:hypothetical protein